MLKFLISFIKNLFGEKETTIPDNPGLIESPKDRRDISLEWMQPKIELRELPKEYIIPYKLKILYQNGHPACVGFSSAVMKSEKERREQNAVDFDGLWIYKKCKEIDNYSGNGTFFRVGMKVLQKVGAKPLNTLETEASKFKIGSYMRVNNLSFDGLKSAIYQNGVILAGFHGDKEGWRTAYLKPPKRATFGHAVALIGWNKDYIIGQNSFGESWGDKGLFYLPKNYLPFEAWAILTDLPSQDFDLTPNLPKYEFKNDLYSGMRNNEEVKILQKILKLMGCFPLAINETGNYFSITVKAVKCYQARKGISQVGRFGPLTRAAMNEELNT